MIYFKQSGDFSKLNKFYEKIKEAIKIGVLDKYGRMGVAALAASTPVDTGLTANSWYYNIMRNDGSVSLEFSNSNIVDGYSIAIILRYGHGTRNGGYVQGRDYITPAVQPIFDQMAKDAWNEVTKV